MGETKFTKLIFEYQELLKSSVKKKGQMINDF